MKNEIVNNDLLTVRVSPEPVHEVVEGTIDAIENATERVVEITRNNPYVIGAVAVVALGVGGFAGYQYARKQLVTKYEERLREEIKETRELFAELYPAPEPPTEEVIAERDAQNALRTYRGADTVTSKATTAALNKKYAEVPDITNVGELPSEIEAFDYRAEIASRTPDKPYVISYDEQQESPYICTNVTYYAADDTLVDDKDEIVDDVERIVGEANLHRFGYGSGDPGTVFIRNERLSLDFEVSRDDGAYADIVVAGYINPHGRK